MKFVEPVAEATVRQVYNDGRLFFLQFFTKHRLTLSQEKTALGDSKQELPLCLRGCLLRGTGVRLKGETQRQIVVEDWRATPRLTSHLSLAAGSSRAAYVSTSVY